ncbi:DUF3993 domain-containing protein [Cytobacillus sp. FJAT-54145]|uniref:DUF3993 domain-containing protein n=1 Tax=Cytobacillus spartinae TaxID=3299023 RepID=A0ABW6KIX1_9BACI
MQKLRAILITFLGILFIFPSISQAQMNLEKREDVLEFLEYAFEAQVSLNEHERTLEEINDILSPFFSEDYRGLFLEENLVEMDGKFITFGTDFALYYIPFFKFSDHTNVVFQENEIYVYEFFPANGEGPVTYKDHYEGLLLKKIDDEWKVQEYLYDNIPETIIQNEQTAKIEFNQPSSVKDIVSPYSQLKLFMSPLEGFISLGAHFSTHEVDGLYALFPQNKIAYK